MSIAETFDALGKPDGIGCGFAVTQEYIAQFGGDIDKVVASFPTPGYQHTIWLDEISNCVMVIRPNKDGTYVWNDGKLMDLESCKWKRRLR